MCYPTKQEMGLRNIPGERKGELIGGCVNWRSVQLKASCSRKDGSRYMIIEVVIALITSVIMIILR